MYRFIVILILAALFFVACAPQPQFEPEFNREGQELSITLIVHKNQREVNVAYNNWVGEQHVLDISTRQLGWATWTADSCTIHINGDLKRTNRKEYFQTLGHEFAHCIYGRYHD